MTIKILTLAISAVLFCTTRVWADNTMTGTSTGNVNAMTAEQAGGDYFYQFL